ncbi:MAG TPA: aminotransferase class IV [Coleofasciculaceae cyanobacterium]|jgi:branched-chain amino acid aminotransferase
MHWELPAEEGSPPREWLNFPTALLYGYQVYTTFRWPIEARWLHRHMERLESDARAIGLDWRCDRENLTRQLEACFQQEMPVMRLTVVADADAYGDFFKAPSPSGRLLLSTRTLPAGRELLRLKSIRYQRPLPTIKLGAMAPLILTRRKAMAGGFDDVLLVSPQGHLCEASTANIFFIREGGLYTPDPERDGCLPGITRLQVLEAAETLGIPIQTKSPISVWALRRMDGAFLTNAVQGIEPVRCVDQIAFPWSDSAMELLKKLVTALSLRDKP